MIHKHGIDKKIKSQKISSLFPGCGISSEDTGLGTIGKIDHARIPSGITIKMHPHINDDILSYFRTGVSKHMDSENISAEISRKRLMLMQAGSIFYHEERILEPLEGLRGTSWGHFGGSWRPLGTLWTAPAAIRKTQ